MGFTYFFFFAEWMSFCTSVSILLCHLLIFKRNLFSCFEKSSNTDGIFVNDWEKFAPAPDLTQDPQFYALGALLLSCAQAQSTTDGIVVPLKGQQLFDTQVYTTHYVSYSLRNCYYIIQPPGGVEGEVRGQHSDLIFTLEASHISDDL